jgi:hypothetical protein
MQREVPICKISLRSDGLPLSLLLCGDSQVDADGHGSTIYHSHSPETQFDTGASERPVSLLCVWPSGISASRR